jgi:PAS domain S-box-containing protein
MGIILRYWTICIFLSCFSIYARDTLRVQLKWFHQFQFAGFYAAQHRGYYDAANLHVDLVEFTSGTDLFETLYSEKADFVVATTRGIIEREQGNPVVAVGALMQHSPLAIMTKSEDEILHPKDLEGRKVAYLPTRHAEIQAMLRKYNVDIDKITSKEPTWDISDLIENRVDAATCFVSDWPYIAGQNNFSYSLIRPRAYGIDFYGDILYTHESLIEKRPDALRRFWEASLAGWEYALDNPREIIAVIQTEYNSNLTEKHLLFEFKELAPFFHNSLVDFGYMSRKRWNEIIRIYKSLNLMERDVDIDTFLYTPQSWWEKHGAFLLLSAGILLIVAVGALWGIAIFNQRLRKTVRFKTRELFLNRKRLKTTLESIADGVITTNEKGEITWLNRVAVEMIGVSLLEAEEQPIGAVFPIVDRYSKENVMPSVEDIFEGKNHPIHLDSLLLTSSSNNEYYISLTASPVVDEGGRRFGGVVVFRDETQRYLYETQLEKSERLQALGQLATGLVHDFNNILSSIMGSAELLSKDLENIEGDKLLADMILDSSERASGITKKLLELGRSTEDKKFSEIDLGILVNQFKKMIVPLLGKSINLSMEAAPEKLCIRGDEGDIENALMNLCINARDAMPKGGILTVSLSPVYLHAEHLHIQNVSITDEYYAALRITDTGAGMDGRVAERIFDPFFTTKAKEKGTGLGLPMVYKTMEKHGGAIDFKSEPGKGTTFLLYFPLLKY